MMTAGWFYTGGKSEQKTIEGVALHGYGASPYMKINGKRRNNWEDLTIIHALNYR